MKGSRGQSLADADRDVRQYLIRIAGTLGEALGDALGALYVRGSLALGTYHRERSDLNLTAVVKRPLTPPERERVARLFVSLSDGRPTRGDVEIEVVEESRVRAGEFPAISEVRYSTDLHEPIRRRKVAYENGIANAPSAAHAVELRDAGVTFVGPPPQSIFPPVPWHAFVSALRAELERARSIAPKDPAGAILAACRVLHGTTSRGVCGISKDDAAAWALNSAAPDHRSVINDALQLYRGSKSSDDVVFDRGEVKDFLNFVSERSAPAFERAAGDGDEGL